MGVQMQINFFKKTKNGYSHSCKKKKIIQGNRRNPFCYNKDKKLWKNENNEIWLPVSVAAYLLNISCQTIRLLHSTGQIIGVKYPYIGLLVNINEIENLKYK